MKKNLVKLTLMSTLLISSTVYADKALPTPQSISMNGRDVSNDILVYNINNENYFRLRDFAKLLNESPKRISVNFDNSSKSILINQGQPYIDEGRAPAGDRTAVKNAVLSSHNLIIDGRTANVKAFNVDGNNYFRLRDLGSNLNVGVDYVKSTNSVLINTGKEYTVEDNEYYNNIFNNVDNFNNTNIPQKEIVIESSTIIEQESKKDAKYQNAINNWVANNINSGMSDEEKIKTIHDWMINRATYTYGDSNDLNKEGYNVYTPQAIMLGTGGVCQSYAMLFHDLARLSGLTDKYVFGTCDNGSGKVSHVWNLVKLNGKWYHLDVTWDDPINKDYDILRYDYYLRNDDFMRKTHTWSGMPEAPEDYSQNYKKSYVPVTEEAIRKEEEYRRKQEEYNNKQNEFNRKPVESDNGNSSCCGDNNLIIYQDYDKGYQNYEMNEKELSNQVREKKDLIDQLINSIDSYEYLLDKMDKFMDKHIGPRNWELNNEKNALINECQRLDQHRNYVTNFYKQRQREYLKINFDSNSREANEKILSQMRNTVEKSKIDLQQYNSDVRDLEKNIEKFIKHYDEWMESLGSENAQKIKDEADKIREEETAENK